MAKVILVSRCLLGVPCKYDGGHNYHHDVATFLVDKPYVTVCPECDGGLPVPRLPAEIRDGRVVDEAGRDLTNSFWRGAEIALQKAKKHEVVLCIFKDGSPSCGVHRRYDGSFQHRSLAAPGVTTVLLQEHGFPVLAEDDRERWRQCLAGN